MLNS
ncbi:hypothetical protein F383_29595 [Gossypium arboreum]|jgi:hypothetical protein